jgi:hypothetical protein
LQENAAEQRAAAGKFLPGPGSASAASQLTQPFYVFAISLIGAAYLTAFEY